MTNPFFSVIITSRNYGHFLHDCLKSVKSQVFVDYQLIGVDAGSIDDTKDIFLKEDNCLYLTAKPGSHVLACYEGLKHATGRYVLFLDGDDMISPITLKVARDYLFNDFVKIQYGLIVFSQKILPSRSFFPHFPKSYDSLSIKYSFNLCGTYIWPVTSGNIYKRDFLDKCFPFLTNLPLDGQLNTIAPSFGEIATIPMPLGFYRVHKNSASFTKLLPFKEENFRRLIRKRLKEYFWSRRRAIQLGLYYPKVNILNYELQYLTYRAILKRMGSQFFLDKKSGLLFFLFCILRIIIKNLVNRRVGITSFAWILGLFFLPTFLIPYYASYRFSRSYGGNASH